MAFEKRVPESDSPSLHHVVANSPWDEEGVLADIAVDVSSRIGDGHQGSLHLDESGCPKQGKHSVGVARQYGGRLGKVDTCPVGVFLGSTHGTHRMLLEKRLYLPQEWAEDVARRQASGVPAEITFHTKAQLGVEMLRQAQKRAIPSAWRGRDSHYGQQSGLLQELERDGEVYIADIPGDTRVWLAWPQTESPARQGRRGRLPSKWKLVEGTPAPVEVRQLAQSLLPSGGKRVSIRDTERGEWWARVVCLRVYPVRDALPGPETGLILREDAGQTKRKYPCCNAPEETPFER